MKRFIIKVLAFILFPVILIGIVEAFILPPNFFTYRTWEALVFKNPIPHQGGFYPNMKTEMDEQGDLAHHTLFAQTQKNVKWITDELGFRNDSNVDEPDILIIGDSFTVGVTLSQEETITNQVSAKLGGAVKVYNMAPSSFGNFDFFLKNGLIKKPKVILFSLVERSLPFVATLQAENSNSKLKYLRIANKALVMGKFNTSVDRFFAFNSIKWATSRANNKTGNGVQSSVDSTMFFFEGKGIKLFSVQDATKTAEAIQSYKKYCDDAGIGFIFLPMPNKESVYPDLVPLAGQPDFLFNLDSLLQKSGVNTINTLQVYNSGLKKGRLLYNLDDTHWNEMGVELIAEEIVNHPLIKSTFKK